MPEVLDAPKTATRPTTPTTKTQNYRRIRGDFGGYKVGSILPEFAIRQAGNLEEMLARREWEPTDAAVNVKLTPPKVSSTPDVSRETFDQLNELRADNERLRDENLRLDNFVKATAKRENDLKESLANYVADLAHVNRVLVEKDAEIASLTKQYETLGAELLATQKDLDAATATATKEAPKIEAPKTVHPKK